MCLLVWIGSVHAPVLAPAARPEQPDPLLGYHYVEAVPRGAPITRHFELPCVTYVGSHQGCGCGYNADDYVFADIDEIADALPLLDALTDGERVELLASQRSREMLRGLIAGARSSGDVEVYARWAGDEELAPIDTREVDADYFARRLRPMQEGVKCLVRARAESNPPELLSG